MEVVEKIAYDVDKGLLNVSLVCQAFYHPAMDALWKNMGGIEPLVRCLPEGVLGDTDGLLVRYLPLHRVKGSHFSPRLFPYDQRRRIGCDFNTMPVRIRELLLAWLDLEDESFTGIDFSMYKAIRDYYPFLRLLPNLKTLTCHDNMSEFAGFLIQPILKVFTIYDVVDSWTLQRNSPLTSRDLAIRSESSAYWTIKSGPMTRSYLRRSTT